jgi:hypothetical protein
LAVGLVGAITYTLVFIAIGLFFLFCLEDFSATGISIASISVTSVRVYASADTYKALAIKENKGKSGVYR